MKKAFILLLFFPTIICFSQTDSTASIDNTRQSIVVKIILNSGNLNDFYPKIIIENSDTLKRINILSVAGDVVFRSTHFNTKLVATIYNTSQGSNHELFKIKSVANKSLTSNQSSQSISWGDSVSMDVSGGNPKNENNGELDLTMSYEIISK